MVEALFYRFVISESFSRSFLERTTRFGTNHIEHEDHVQILPISSLSADCAKNVPGKHTNQHIWRITFTIIN